MSKTTQDNGKYKPIQNSGSKKVQLNDTRPDVGIEGNKQGTSKSGSTTSKMGMQSRSKTNVRNYSRTSSVVGPAPSGSKLVEKEMLTMTEDSSLEHCIAFLKERHFFHDFAEVFVDLYKMEEEDRPADPMKFILNALIHNLPQMKKFSAMVLSFTSRLEDLKNEKHKVLRQIRYFEHRASKTDSREFRNETDVSEVEPISEGEDWSEYEEMDMEGKEQNTSESKGGEETENEDDEDDEDELKQLEAKLGTENKEKANSPEPEGETKEQTEINSEAAKSSKPLDEPKPPQVDVNEVSESEEYDLEYETDDEYEDNEQKN